jgi:hypothetical protein
MGDEAHAIGVRGQELVVAEDEVAALDERHLDMAAERELLLGADRGDDGRDGIGIDAFGLIPGEAEDHRGIGGVAAAGERERSEQLAGNGSRRAAVQRGFGKGVRGAHRAHGVRTRRADADREEIGEANGRFRPGAGPGVGSRPTFLLLPRLFGWFGSYAQMGPHAPFVIPAKAGTQSQERCRL